MITGSSLSFGGLGFRSLSYHSCAAFISSLSSSGFGSASNRHLLSAISKLNAFLCPLQRPSQWSLFCPLDPLSQHALCKKLDYHLFQSIVMTSSPANKARLLSASVPYASLWLSVLPSLGLGLQLDPAEFQIAVMWWLGMNSSIQISEPILPQYHFGSSWTSCRHRGDVVIRHNHLRNIFAEFCRRAHLSVRVEVGQGLSRVQRNSCPADVLVDALGKGHYCYLHTSLVPRPSIEVYFKFTETSIDGLGTRLPPHSLLLLCMTRVIPQVLQLTKQSAKSTLPMTQSIRSQGGYVFLWQWSLMGTGAKRPRTSSLE
eukprot:Em0002g210a